MDVIGEVHCTLTRGEYTSDLDALVVRQLDVDILTGNPFMVRNDIGVRPAKREIEIGGSEVIHYGRPSRHTTRPTVRRTQSFLLRNSHQTVVLPGEYVQFNTPLDSDPDMLWALEPRLDSPSNSPLKPEDTWPQPQDIRSVGRAVRIPNTTVSPILLKSGEQVCHIRPLAPIVDSPHPIQPHQLATPPIQPSTPFSSGVSLDPDDCLSQNLRDEFSRIHLAYDDHAAIPKYNGASGNIQAFVNKGPTLPPQRKGRLPMASLRPYTSVSTILPSFR